MTTPLQEPWQVALLQYIAERFASNEQLGALQASVTAQQAALDTQTTELRSVSSLVAATSATIPGPHGRIQPAADNHGHQPHLCVFRSH